MGRGAELNGDFPRDRHVCLAASVGIQLASSLFPRFAAQPSVGIVGLEPTPGPILSRMPLPLG